MAITQGKPWWTGTDAADLVEFLQTYAAGGYAVSDVRVVGACAACGSAAGFRLRVDDEQGYAARTCAACGDTHVMLDSAGFAKDADPGPATCPCGQDVFDVAVGFADRADGDVRWVSVGLRCRADGVLGCYADWKIDYSPTTQLRTSG